MSSLDSMGKTYFHIVIFNTVDFRDSSSLLRTGFFFPRISTLKGSSEMGRLLGKYFKQRQLLPLYNESDKKALVLLAQNSL